MRVLYHEFESLEHLLANRLLPGGSQEPVRFVVFGGTGAVGGAVVLELMKLILRSKRYRKSPLSGEIYATGMSDKDITHFVSRIYLALGKSAPIEKVEARRHYRIDGRIELRFALLRLALPEDLREQVAAARAEAGKNFDLEASLGAYFEAQPRPFLEFVEGLGSTLLHAVAVAIPLPSVATYTLERLEALAAEHGLDHGAQQRIKSHFLRNFIRGLAVVQQRHARHVVIAHTTAVGGMYRVDGGSPEIRLGFAHSASGKRMVEKKHFADELTQLYIDHGFDVLITAAAIGIDAVEFHCRLPLERAVAAALKAGATSSIAPEDLEKRQIALYPAHDVPLDEGEWPVSKPLWFGEGKALTVEAAIRSGENGLFSVANCVALYNVMKVAIPEELAMVLVRHALFGPERRRDWYRDKVCYYHETDNAHFALRLLESQPKLVRAHLGTFCVQAYQALGSATHQARLHELGLLNLLLRLRDLGRGFAAIPEQTLATAVSDLEGFFWQHTRLPAFEDLEDLSSDELAQRFGELCEVDSKEGAGLLLGYDLRRHGVREGGREKFLARLATTIRRYLSTITSLGLPIVYRSPRSGHERLLIGPYVAPLERAVASSRDVLVAWEALAVSHGLPFAVARDWSIVNNGFIDLRPHAIASAAKESSPRLAESVQTMSSAEEVEGWIATLPVGAYFTTCGTVALAFRLRRLGAQVCGRRIELGTFETWKHLFQQDVDGRFVLAPGLVETVRMYSEGLGKVTGTEALWPAWGY